MTLPVSTPTRYLGRYQLVSNRRCGIRMCFDCSHRIGEGGEKKCDAALSPQPFRMGCCYLVHHTNTADLPLRSQFYLREPLYVRTQMGNLLPASQDKLNIKDVCLYHVSISTHMPLMSTASTSAAALPHLSGLQGGSALKHEFDFHIPDSSSSSPFDDTLTRRALAPPHLAAIALLCCLESGWTPRRSISRRAGEP